MAPAAQHPGAYRYVGLRLAVARGVIHSKDMLEGIVLWLAGPLQPLVPGRAVAGIAGPGRTEWRVQSCVAFLASPGRNLPDWHTLRGRLMSCGSPVDLVVHTMCDRSRPVAHGHASQLNIRRSGAQRVGLC